MGLIIFGGLVIILVLVISLIFIFVFGNPKDPFSQIGEPEVNEVIFSRDFSLSDNFFEKLEPEQNLVSRDIVLPDVVDYSLVSTVKKKGLQKLDNYLQSFTSHLFSVEGKRWCPSSIFPIDGTYTIDRLDSGRTTISDDGKEITLMANYHHISCNKNITEMKEKDPRSRFVVIDGEPSQLRWCPLHKRDLLISNKKDPKYLPIGDYSYVYMPYYSYNFLYERNLDISLLIKGDTPQPEKSKFCAFAYSNTNERFGGVINRRDFYFLFQSMSNGRVDNLGRAYNPNPPTKFRNDNDTLLLPYKFAICIENEDIDGYITEKLVYPMCCGCIPIYLGSPDVGEHFNTKSFINVRDFDSWEDCINYVLLVDSNEELRQSILREPWFVDNVPNKYFNDLMQRGSDFYKKVYEPLLDTNLINIKNYFTQKVAMATFSDGVMFTYNRIVTEALASDYFDSVFAYLPKDISPEFTQKHASFIENSKRGYGYYIWKPQVISQALEKLDDGDLLIWADSGSVIIPGKSGKIIEYYNLAKNSPTGILGFKIKFLSKYWIKRDTVDYLSNYYSLGIEIDDIINDFTLTSGLFYIVKNEKSVAFVREWDEHVTKDYHYIDDTPSELPEIPGFGQSRCEQSIFDVMMKVKKGTFTLDNFDDSKMKFRPINLCRIKK